MAELIANEFGAHLGRDSGAIWVPFALFVFGFVFNQLINYLHRHGYNDGYTWLEVVVGVGVTIFFSGFVLGWGAVLILLFLFGCSGFWMAAGDIIRHVRARRAENEQGEGVAQ